MFSPTCQYAIRALMVLADHHGRGPMLARDVASIENIPRQFLSKILHQLGQKGLVKSQKGPGGGFALHRAADHITVGEIVEAVDGPHNETRRCLLGLRECSDVNSCALHGSWKQLRTDYDERIGALTLSDLVRQRREKQSASS